MNVLHVLLIGLFLSIAMALLSGCVYLLVKEKRDRRSIATVNKEGQHSYMEVWQCPNCNRLSRIARRCKWCMKEMPNLPKFLTVREREYTDQLLLPRPEPRRNPPDDSHLPNMHP
jgi:hypothetical protein